MATRTVRLDDESEALLRSVVRRTGLSVSEVLKAGIETVANDTSKRGATAFAVFSRLDLGPGGYAIAPSTEVRRGVRESLRRRRRR
jgi:pimeloyl-CoA synthetase